MASQKKLRKLETLVAAQEMTEETMEGLWNRLTENSSEQELMVFGRHQMTVLVLDAQIRKLRHELGLKHSKAKFYKM